MNGVQGTVLWNLLEVLQDLLELAKDLVKGRPVSPRHYRARLDHVDKAVEILRHVVEELYPRSRPARSRKPTQQRGGRAPVKDIPTA